MKIDLTGKVFGRWTVLMENTIKSKDGRPRWNVICECGTNSTVSGSDLRRGHTKSCGCYSKEVSSKIRVIVYKIENNIQHKLCAKCKTWKELNFFTSNKYNKDKIDHYCMECRTNKRTKERYGIDLVTKQKMFAQQNQQCQICFKVFNDLAEAFIDHCHVTKQIRGLLCTKCNTAIGFLNDDLLLVENALLYLKKYKENK